MSPQRGNVRQVHLDRREFLAMIAGAAAASGIGGGAAEAEGVMTQDQAPLASNDNVKLTPRTQLDGRKLSFDFPGMLIGCAEYDEGPTGCTVFQFPKRVTTAVADIRGGAPATIFTDHLASGAGWLDAICLAGGSCYGLEAATGVSAELLKQGGYDRSFGNIALVTGAIIYDFRPRQNAIYPDHALGRAALRAAKEGQFPLGPRGAGRSATCGKWGLPDYQWETAGQGAAFKQTGETKIACFTVVNAVGSILDRTGKVVRGALNARTNKRVMMRDVATDPSAPATRPAEGNTTLSVLVTNRRLDGYSLRQLARQVHSSMARAIDPFHTTSDGDVLFAVATSQVRSEEPDVNRMGVIAAELMWDAVLSCWDS